MKRICVYCGSSPGKHPLYAEAARTLAEELLRRKLGLVYGGSNIGLMGQIADTVLKGGGEVIGVIPQFFAEKHLDHRGLTDLRIVSSMHERKAMMAELSDGFIALPGGLGTFEEIFEVLTWSQLQFHHKPCALLNTNKYYHNLVLFLDHAVEQKFIRRKHRRNLLIAEYPRELLDQMAVYRTFSKK